MANKNELNKGLKALLGDIEKKNAEEKKEFIRELSHTTAMIPVEAIEINPFQPRNEFENGDLEELARSIKTHGLIQPITVRKLGGNKFQIISGERRWRATKLAGLEDIPAYIRIADDQSMMEMALVENIQRTDLNPLEIAMAYRRLLDEFELTHETMAERVGKTRSSISNYLRLLKLPPTIQQGIKEEKISFGHAKVLAGLDELSLQLKCYQDILLEALSVRGLERRIQSVLKTGRKPKKKEPAQVRHPSVVSIENKLKSLFETQVSIKRNAKGAGSIQIPFGSDEELNDILEKMDI
jgi:ParB family chromosome partitioning protein